MKFRNGFVSNSSSSSFVIFVTKEVYDKVYSTISDLEKSIVDNFTSDAEDFLGRKIKRYSYNSGDSGDWEYEQVRECIENAKTLKKSDDIDAKISNTMKVLSDEEEHNDNFYYDFAFSGFEDLLKIEANKMNENVITHSVQM